MPTVLSGRYEPERLVARGGMADVYKARDRLLNRTVALKVLFKELSVDHAFVERFRREAQAAAGLSHRNIVSVFDWGEDGSTYYIVMEFVNGLPLSATLRANGPFAPFKVAETAAEVAAALSYAHRHNVVHRDVKPGNIVITEDGQVKVMDFGIARAFNTEDSLTQTGSVMGTATYFSPEQAEGIGVDGRSDIYSLGVVMFEMIAGKPPFVGDSPVAVASKHVRELPPALSDMVPSVPPQLDKIIARCLNKSPQLRYQTADDLRADLINFIEGREVRGVDSPDATTVIPVTRPPIGLDGSTTTVMQPVGRYDQGLQGARGGREVERKSRTGLYSGILVAMLVALAVIVAFLGQALGYWHLGSAAAVKATVPHIYGQSLSRAESLIKAGGLKVGTINQVPTGSAAAGTVLRSSPAESSKALKGSTVDLWVAETPPQAQVKVPSVVGQDLQQAEDILSKAQLSYTAIYVNSATAPANQVTNQQPGQGALAKPHSQVQLFVSNGQPPPTSLISVPSVATDTVTQAADALGKAGFNVSSTYSYAYSPSVYQGYVVGTTPPAGSQEKSGATVTLIVSEGPEPTVPNVVGDDVNTAETALTADGFQPAAVCQSPTAPDNPHHKGVVVNQNPTGGTPAPSGSTVTIYGDFPSSYCSTPSTTTTSTSSSSSSSTTSPSTTSSTTPIGGLP